MKIKTIRRVQADTTVYNFATSTHHNYFAEHLLVHNCYRDSTADGQHATLTNLRTIAWLAAQAGVLEVALGGGEITQHPAFVEVLRAFHAEGVVTNFTTRAPAEVARQWAEIEPLIGAFAVSVGSPGEVDRLAALLHEHGVPPARVNLHLVMGTLSQKTFRAVTAAAAHHRLRVTLLGFKTTGRGEGFREQPHDWWTDELPRCRELGLDVSIDTALAARFEAQILQAGVPSSHFHLHEGRYSAFIDAVSMTLAASSYEPARGHVPLTGDWLEHFRGF